MLWNPTSPVPAIPPSEERSSLSPLRAIKHVGLTLLFMLAIFAGQAEYRYQETQRRKQSALERQEAAEIAALEAQVMGTKGGASASRELERRKEALRQVRREQAYHMLREHLETAVNLAEVARAEKLKGQTVTTRHEMRVLQIEIERVAKRLQDDEALGSVRDFAHQAAKAVGSGDFQSIQRHYWFCVVP